MNFSTLARDEEKYFRVNQWEAFYANNVDLNESFANKLENIAYQYF